MESTFASWNPQCGAAAERAECIRFYNIHEFGHVLGFLHEQDRVDAPLFCPNGSSARTGTDAGIGLILGP